ncbi:tRNA-splicing endonuclease subunit Sen34 [Pseudomyrmex gracilis]|uniref:tRNA-splicing endonuclease subunit Sen34 n=1 Tax=Pseudomyrmex gracilis TaxID=219809 RepID=UPI000995781A|nr:tRNA-splicing endonuclease subunit Sen34 [Pseudomyrmex gracilis]
MNTSDIIYLISSKNNVFIWNADDWLRLRRDHRIIGGLIGSFAKATRQDAFSGLPLLLSPDEVTILIEKGIARLVECTSLEELPSESLKKKLQDYRDQLFEDQEKCLRENKKKQVMAFMDRIVEGKKRKMLGMHTGKKNKNKMLDKKAQEAMDNIEINTQTLLEEEVAKLPKLKASEALIQTHLAYPWSSRDNIKTVDWKYPFTATQKLKYKVYKNLWERGYYISNGEQFGGHFLAYMGDPLMFHSQFIIQCRSKDEEISVVELMNQCRISCQVRKTFVFAIYCEKEDKVYYQSFQWAESKALQNS